MQPPPGPRPYECVRRAWHSDRHQPIRGSLIQEIFRVVNEIHSSATKRNKEWQVKLPVVVLKAEEIMYSKANSEAEYMDLKTLRDRINDAINTIIRRDESTEAGELLQPCIEAALNLGCTPRRASRSQRNTNPRCYLSPGTQDPSTSTHGNVNSSFQANHINNSQLIPNCLSFIQPRVSSCANSVSGSKDVACDDNKLTSDKVFIAPDNVLLPTKNKSLHMENHPESSSYLVYPLYYGSCLEPECGVAVLPNSVSSTAEPVKVGVIHNLLSCYKKVPSEASEVDVKNSPLDQHETECDLSLRLGSVSAPSLSVENNRLQKVEDVGCGSSQEGSKFNVRMQPVDKDFNFCSSVNVGDPLNSSSSKLSEHMNADLRAKKRKAAFGHLDEDQPFWQARLPSNQLTVRMKSAGS